MQVAKKICAAAAIFISRDCFVWVSFWRPSYCAIISYFHGWASGVGLYLQFRIFVCCASSAWMIGRQHHMSISRKRFKSINSKRGPALVAMVRACLGAEGGPECAFAKDGKAVQPKHGNLRCSWCDPGLLRGSCGSAGGRAQLKQRLRNMVREVQMVALQRLPEEAYVEHFEAEFGARVAAEEPEEAAEAEELSEASDVELEGGDAIAELDLGELIEQNIAEGIQVCHGPEEVEEGSHAGEDEEDFVLQGNKLAGDWKH